VRNIKSNGNPLVLCDDTAMTWWQTTGMTIVLVHGNPETTAVWDDLAEAIGREDIVRLSPPGFGAPLPANWPAGFLDYRDWLEDELIKLGSPVDLVGHDWGGAHVLNAVMDRPELVRSWVSDVVVLFDQDYVWHDMARVFQTAGEGERLVTDLMGGPLEERIERLCSYGLTAKVAAKMAKAIGPEMGQAVLQLYRSARQPAMAEAGRGLERARARPGLSIVATEDPFVVSGTLAQRAADRAGAGITVLEGLGHWWMTQEPERSADILNRFWESLDLLG
jgi:pimeloyl-ACP methyl ester carboxylesterase